MERYTPIQSESSERYHIEVWRDSFRNETVAEGYEKLKGGVQYFVGRYKSFNMPQFKKDISTDGWFSPRPYQLAQHCDGSIHRPVSALYYHYYKQNGIDQDATIERAYPDIKGKTDWEFILKEAGWQGVVIPEEWGEKEFEWLQESLTEINLHCLNDTLREMREEIEKRQSEIQKIRMMKQQNKSRNLGR